MAKPIETVIIRDMRWIKHIFERRIETLSATPGKKRMVNSCFVRHRPYGGAGAGATIVIDRIDLYPDRRKSTRVRFFNWAV